MNIHEYLKQKKPDYKIGIELLKQHDLSKAIKLETNKTKPINQLLYELSKYILNITPVIKTTDEPSQTPLITVITRTSFRMQRFIECANSVINQTYPNIHHMILCDNNDAVKYVSDYYKKIKNKKYSIYRLQKQSSNKGFYNIYFNHAIPRVHNDSYILLLDDDDKLISNTCIEEFFQKIKQYNGFYIVQFKREINNIKPKPELFKKNDYHKGDVKSIIKGKIGGSCVIFKKYHTASIEWDDDHGSDYRFIKKMGLNYDYKYIPHVIVQSTSTGNKGK